MTETERITYEVLDRHFTPADSNILELRLLALGRLAAHYELRAEQSSGAERIDYRSKAEEFRKRQRDLLMRPGPQLVPESLVRALENCCPVCGENPGVFLDGRPLCVNCESQLPTRCPICQDDVDVQLYTFAQVLNLPAWPAILWRWSCRAAWWSGVAFLVFAFLWLLCPALHRVMLWALGAL